MKSQIVGIRIVTDEPEKAYESQSNLPDMALEPDETTSDDQIISNSEDEIMEEIQTVQKTSSNVDDNQTVDKVEESNVFDLFGNKVKHEDTQIPSSKPTKTSFTVDGKVSEELPENATNDDLTFSIKQEESIDDSHKPPEKDNNTLDKNNDKALEKAKDISVDSDDSAFAKVDEDMSKKTKKKDGSQKMLKLLRESWSCVQKDQSNSHQENNYDLKNPDSSQEDIQGTESVDIGNANEKSDHENVVDEVARSVGSAVRSDEIAEKSVERDKEDEPNSEAFLTEKNDRNSNNQSISNDTATEKREHNIRKSSRDSKSAKNDEASDLGSTKSAQKSGKVNFQKMRRKRKASDVHANSSRSQKKKKSK